MGRGRPKDTAPEGFYTVAEAAELLGITPSAIRQRIARGRLSTGEGQDVTGSLEPRHYIPKAELERALAEQTLPAERRHVDTSTEAVMGKVDAMIAKFEEMALAARGQRDAIEDAVKSQDEHIVTRLEAVERNQETINTNLERAIQVMVETAAQEKAYQDRMMEMLDRESERQEEQRRRGEPESWGWFRRLFFDRRRH